MKKVFIKDKHMYKFYVDKLAINQLLWKWIKEKRQKGIDLNHKLLSSLFAKENFYLAYVLIIFDPFQLFNRKTKSFSMHFGFFLSFFFGNLVCRVFNSKVQMSIFQQNIHTFKVWKPDEKQNKNLIIALVKVNY